MNYRIEVRPAAVRALRHVHSRDRARIQGAIRLLAADPRPPGARKLQGRDGYRVRVGDYRILYAIHDDVLLVVVVMLGQRGDVSASHINEPRRNQDSVTRPRPPRRHTDIDPA